MEILEAFDLAGTPRGAAALVGRDHETVAHRIDELVDRSHGRIRADAAHRKLVAMGIWVRSARHGFRQILTGHPNLCAVDLCCQHCSRVGC